MPWWQGPTFMVLSLATSITHSSPWIRFLSFMIIQYAVANTPKQNQLLSILEIYMDRNWEWRNNRNRNIHRSTCAQVCLEHWWYGTFWRKHGPNFIVSWVFLCKVRGYATRKATLLYVGPLNTSPNGHAYSTTSVIWASLRLWDRGGCPPQRPGI
jgi:hypothetical protein